MTNALQEEINNNYIAAAELYEGLYNGGTMTKEDYANLAFLYWQFSNDYAFSECHNIPQKVIDQANDSYAEIIKVGLEKYPKSVELKFWNKYFPHRSFFQEFSYEECKKLVQQGEEDKNLIPYFYLYLFNQEKYKIEKDELLKQCEQTPNTKFNYIKSILQSNALMYAK